MNQRGKVQIGLFCFLVIIIFTSQIFTRVVFASWKNMDRTAIFENISNNSADSYVPQLQIAANNIPYIVWSDNSTGNGDIYFKKWTPSVGWIKMNGDTGFDNLSNNSGASTLPQIKLNSENIPYVIWQDSDDVFFTKWTVGAGPSVCGTGIDDCWTKMDGTLGHDNVSNTGGYSVFEQLAIDHQDNPYIVWRETITDSDKEIYFSKWTPSVGWTNMDGSAEFDNLSDNAGFSDLPQIQIDSHNHPYVIWQDSTTGSEDIYFTHWDGAKWSKMSGDLGYDNLSNNSGASELWQNIQSFVLDNNNNPYAVWHDYTVGNPNAEVYFSKWTPEAGWTSMDGVTPGYDNLSNDSGISGVVSIQLDVSQNPYVVWHDNTTGKFDIYFSKWTPAATTWTSMDGVTPGHDNLSNNAGNSQYARLILDNAYRPFVYWFDDTNTSPFQFELYLTKWTPNACSGSGCWTKMDGVNTGYDIISNNASITGFAQIQLDNMNFSDVVWQNDNSGNFEVYFTRWVNDQAGQIEISASVEPSLSLSLPSATSNLGTFNVSNIVTGVYNISVSTNGSGGYSTYLRADGQLRNATNNITDVTGGAVADGTEAYGVSTTKASQDIAQINDANNDTFYTAADCTTMNGNTITANASAITTSDQQFASADSPISDDETSLCFAVAISGNTPAGSYSQILNLTVVANF